MDMKKEDMEQVGKVLDTERVKPEVKKLVDVTKECVELGLEQVKPWGFLGDMGQAVHDHAYANGYTVVREIGGHGVGLEFHEDPWVGYNTRKGTDMVMAPGMMFTIEPMVNMGKVNVVTDENFKINASAYRDFRQNKCRQIFAAE